MSPRRALAPGLRILDRSPDHAQIGLTPSHRVRVELDPGMRRVLSALDRGEPVPTDPHSRAALDRVQPVLVDADALAPLGVASRDAAALALVDRPGYAARLRRRRVLPVAVLDELHGPVAAADLLGAAGFPVVTDPQAAAAVLLLTLGEPDRARLDPWIRDGRPHHLVRAVEGTFVVGPLVEPGRTACVRCVDAHHGLDDPGYPVVATRHHRGARRDGVAEPVDSALAALAVGWAVRDLVAHLDGAGTASWSATVELGPAAGSVLLVSWLRHAGCGCAWIDGADESDTMGP